MTDSSTDAPATGAAPKKVYRPRPNGQRYKGQTPPQPRTKMVSSRHDAAGFEAKARAIQEDDADNTQRARQLAVDNYNAHRDASKLPPWTVELTRVIWFAKVGGNWSAIVGSTVAPGLQYSITYNGHRSEATIEVYKKINVVKIAD